MRNSDWSSDVCSSDLISERPHRLYRGQALLPQSFAQSSPEGRPPQRLASRQQHPGFHVMGPGELHEPRAERQDRKSGVEGKCGSLRFDTGGVRHMKKKKREDHARTTTESEMSQ